MLLFFYFGSPRLKDFLSLLNMVLSSILCCSRLFFLSTAFQKITNPKRLESDLGDSDARYFFQNDSSDVLDLESAVTENPHDTQLWLKLATKKLQNPVRYDCLIVCESKTAMCLFINICLEYL